MTLVPLPKPPVDAAWPGSDWEEASPLPGVDADALTALLDPVFAEPQPETTARTHAMVVAHRGRIVAERYAAGVGPTDTQHSWSMAKSVLNAACGVLIRDGRLRLRDLAAMPQWPPGDRRATITIGSLLHMTPGLRFVEDYVDGDVSDVIKMLFRPGYDDMAAFAAGFSLDHTPDTVFNYSSGTSNIVSNAIKRIVGPGDAYGAFLRRELFDPLGMASAQPRFDASGTWIASSYCFCTPRDFARFGLLYLRDGVWAGHRILPEGWVDYTRTPGPAQPAEPDGRGYGAHWWLMNDDCGTFFASGYVGQYIVVVPALDLVIMRSGETPAARRPHVMQLMRGIIDLFRAA